MTPDFEQDDFRMNHDTTPIDFSDDDNKNIFGNTIKKTAKQEMEFKKSLKTKADLMKHLILGPYATSSYSNVHP